MDEKSPGLEEYDQVLISVIRTVMPSQIAAQICGVQPMTGMTGRAFHYTDYNTPCYTTDYKQLEFDIWPFNYGKDSLVVP